MKIFLGLINKAKRYEQDHINKAEDMVYKFVDEIQIIKDVNLKNHIKTKVKNMSSH